jgi:hypothetical protein
VASCRQRRGQRPALACLRYACSAAGFLGETVPSENDGGWVGTELSRQQRIVSKNPREKRTIRTDVQFGAAGRPKVDGALVFQVETV